jgi:hypothetical protein
MRAFTFDDPDGNGVDDTWGFTCAGANKGTGNLRGFMNLFDRDGVNFYVDQDGKTNHPILDGSFLDYLKVANTIISEGLIYPDWYTQGDEDQFVEIYNGKIGVVYYTPSNYHCQDGQRAQLRRLRGGRMGVHAQLQRL